MTLSAQDRARRIKIILFDVDGVLTDGSIWLVPGPADGSLRFRAVWLRSDGQIGFGVQSATMVEAKGYSAHDGAGHLAGAAGRHEVRHHHQAHHRDRGPARPRPEAGVRLQGAGIQDEADARDHGEGRRDAGRDRLRGRRRDRPAGDARVRTSPWPWPMRASR